MSDLSFADNPAKRRYEAFCDGQLAGFLEYRDRNGATDLRHTETLKAFGGRGVGSFLARSALDKARAEGRKVVPSCGFIADYMKKHPDTLDLAAPDAGS